MPLKIDSPFFIGKNIGQVVAFCGDGKLKDNSPCSEELRQFLAEQNEEQLATHARFCLDNSFDKSGYVLQDIVNEIGRRLGYSVTNGRYQGTKSDAGHDGLWMDGSHDHLIVEVKTTDAYRINLDTVCAYPEKMLASGKAIPGTFHTLIVVGRQDTGDLEAQVRGSRHAWNVRLISVDALIKLMFVKAVAASDFLLDKIRRVLLPFEYTRVDNIVDLVFEAQQEKDFTNAAEADAEDTAELDDSQTEAKAVEPQKSNVQVINEKRLLIADAFFKLHQATSFSQEKRRPLFASIDGELTACVAVSKKYNLDHQPYWYACHPDWLEHIKKGKEGFFVLGCMDREEAYALPRDLVISNLSNLNMTNNDKRHYWHIALKIDNGALGWHLPKLKNTMDLSRFTISLKEHAA